MAINSAGGEGPPKGLRGWSRRDFLRRAGQLGATSAFFGSTAAFLEACAQPSSSTNASPAVKPVKGGHLTEGSIQDITGFNPVTTAPGISLLLSYFLFEGLLSTDNNANLVPAIASALPKISPDNLTYSFSLRKDVKWSDGQPLTAEDVLFTYNLMFDPAYKAVNSTYRSDLETNVASIQAPDPYTVVFTMKKPYAPFLASHGLHGILPKKVLGSLAPGDIGKADFNKAPTVVNGVFKFVEWKQGDHVTLARNDRYYRGPAYLDQYVFKVIGQEPDMVALLQTGQVDCSRIQGPALFDPLTNDQSLRSVSFFTNTIVTWFYNLDTNRPAGRIFSSAKVRQALAYAVDRQALINSVYLKVGATLANEFFLPASWAFDPGVTPKYSVDVAKAQQMLDEEGWKKGADGIRSKDGQKMAFEIVTSSNSKEFNLDAQVMQEAWKNIGADVTVRAIAYTQEIQLANFTHAYDVIVFNTNPGLDPDLTNYWTTRGYGTGGLNASKYSNAQTDRLFDEATSTTDKAKRKQTYAKISDILATDLPAVPIIYPNVKFFFNKRVHGFEGPNGIGTYTLFGPRPFMKDVFVTS